MNLLYKKIIIASCVFAFFICICPSVLWAQAQNVQVSGTQNAQAPDTMLLLPPGPLPEALQKLEETPVKLIGMTLQELLVYFGVPVSVTAVRGVEPWQDDIVFSYNNGIAFYIYKNRVWKIKISAGYRKPFMGLMLGTSADIAVTLFGLPKMQEAQWAEWIVPFENWPMMLRALLDTNGKITALYLYRSDI